MRSAIARKLALSAAALAAFPAISSAQFYTRDGGYVMPAGQVKHTGQLLGGSSNRFDLNSSGALGGPELSSTFLGQNDLDVVDGCGVLLALTPAGGANGWFNALNWSSGVPNASTDTATFNQPPDGLGDFTVDLAAVATMGTINLNNSRGTDIIDTTNAGGGFNVNAGTRLQVNSTRFFPEIDARWKNIFGGLFFGQRIQAPISGAGSVVVSGLAAPVWLTGANSFTGGLTVQNGIVTVADFTSTAVGAFSPPVISEGQFGASTITLDGGTIRLFSNLATPSIIGLSRPIVLGAGGGTIATTTSLGAVTGVISGGGNLNVVRGNTNTNLQAANTYTGLTHIASGSLTVGGAGGRLLNTSGLDLNGTFSVANGGTAGNVDRVNNAAPITSRGGVLRVTSTTSFAETFGDYTTTQGTNSILITTGVTGTVDTVVNLGNVTRQNNSSIAVYGRNLGQTNGTLTTHLTMANGTSLLIGTPALGTTDKAIIPFAVAISNNSATASAGGGIAALSTYDANGFRPLTAAEHLVNTTAGATGESNILVNQVGATALGSATVGALAIASPTLSAVAPAGAVTAGTITLTKGVLLSNAQGNSFNGNLTSTYTNGAGRQELILQLHSDNSPTAGTTVGGNIFGAIDLTKAGPGTYFPTGANTYTGKTALTSGRTIFATNIPASGPGIFGNPSAGNETIELQSAATNLAGGGAAQTRFLNETAGSSLSVGRPVTISGNGAGGVLVGSFAGANIVWNGTFTVGDNAQVITTGSHEFRGNIVGGGVIRDNGGGRTILAGNNSGFTGSMMFNLPGAANTIVVVEPTAIEPFGVGTADIDDVMTFVAQSDFTSSASFLITGAGLGTWSGVGNPTLSGSVDLGAFTSNVQIGSGVGTASAGKLTLSGPLSNGNFILRGVALTGGGSTDFTTGTLEISGNNVGLDSVVFLGDSAVLAGAGTCTNAAAAEVPAGVLRITGSTALGAEDVQINSEGSTVQLANNISLSANNDFFLQGDGVGSGTTALGSLNNASGNNTIAGDLVFADHVNVSGTINTAQTVRVEAGSSLANTGVFFDITTGSGGGTLANSNAVLNKTGGGALTVTRVSATDDSTPDPDTIITLGGLNIVEGRVNVGLTGANNSLNSTSAVKSLVIAAGATLDLGNNSMVVDYAGASPLVALEDLITLGRGAGAWNGTGITSAAAAAGPSGKFSLGIAEQGDTNFGTSFPDDPNVAGGATIDGTSILIRYTLTGDANLSGNVTLDDFTLLAAFFGQPNQRWATGDFNYDGLVNLDDFTALASNFGQSAVDLPRSSVPEPTAFGAIGLAMAGLAARRRRA